MVVPSLPEPTGSHPQKAKFFAELAAALEFMALYYALDVREQAEMRELCQSLAARHAKREVNER